MKILFLALLAFSGSVSAQISTYGDWVVTKTTPGLQIAKTSTGNAVAGIVCVVRSDNCYAYIGTDSPCKEDDRIPMLINSAVGSAMITTKCAELGGSRFNLIEEFDAAKSAMESGGVVGFAMPLLSGEFRVVRFSTRGATAAIREAMTRPDAASVSPSRSDVRL